MALSLAFLTGHVAVYYRVRIKYCFNSYIFNVHIYIQVIILICYGDGVCSFMMDLYNYMYLSLAKAKINLLLRKINYCLSCYPPKIKVYKSIFICECSFYFQPLTQYVCVALCWLISLWKKGHHIKPILDL